MVDEGMGHAISFDKIINTSCTGNLCFRPFSQRLDIKKSLVWKKYRVSTKAVQRFLDKMQDTILTD